MLILSVQPEATASEKKRPINFESQLFARWQNFLVHLDCDLALNQQQHAAPNAVKHGDLFCEVWQLLPNVIRDFRIADFKCIFGELLKS